MKPRCGQEGMIAIATLWTLAILSVVVVSLAYQSRIDVRISGHQLRQVQARALARTAVSRAIAMLVVDRAAGEADHLGEAWCDNPEAFGDVSLGEGTFRVGRRAVAGADRSGAGGWTYGVVDEDRKINVIGLDLLTLVALRELGLDVWVPGMPGGDEDAPQTPLPDDYPQLFPGNVLRGDVGPDELALAGELLTLHGDGRVNINTADRRVLTLLGLPARLAERIVKYRRGPDGVTGTADDRVIGDLSSLDRLSSQLGGLDAGETVALSYLVHANALKVSSQFFRIEASGSVADGRVTRRITAVVERTDDGQAIVRSWCES